MRYAMVIDLRKCVGCSACVAACKQENGIPPGVFRTKVLQYEEGNYPEGRLHFLHVRCMHCEKAPCLESCPTGATYRREDGPVLIDDAKCIGCRYCIMVCAYEARTYNTQEPGEYFEDKGLTPYEQAVHDDHPRGSIEKCTFCAERLDQGKEPACVATCPSGARIFGDLDDPNSEVSKLVAAGLAKRQLEELDTSPLLFFIE